MLPVVVADDTFTSATSGGTPTSAAYTVINKAQRSITRSGSALVQVTGARLTYA